MREYYDKSLIGVTELIGLVYAEDKRQIIKWGYQIHTLFEWLTYTTEELGELAKAISEFTYRDGDKERIVKEAIQTATLCLKIAKMVKEEGQ